MLSLPVGVISCALVAVIPLLRIYSFLAISVAALRARAGAWRTAAGISVDARIAPPAATAAAAIRFPCLSVLAAPPDLLWLLFV